MSQKTNDPMNSLARSNRPTNLQDDTRVNLYKLIHKYARHAINSVTEQAANCDFSNKMERENFIIQFNALFSFLDDHAQREDTYFHPLLKEINSQQLDPIEKDHQMLSIMSDNLKKSLESIDSSDDAYRFYLDFVQFQSSYFNHLDDEETKIMPELHEHFDDKKLNKASDQVLKTMPRDVMIQVTKGMLPAINHSERVMVFLLMKASMPAEPFKGMCLLARSSLAQKQADQLFKAIGVDEIFLGEQTQSPKPNLQLIYVSNIERSTAVYKQLFNAEPVFSSPRYVAFSTDAAGDSLFAIWTGGTQPDIKVPRFSEIGVMMPSREAVDDLFEQWRQNTDLKILKEPYTEAFGRTFLVSDPDGHIIRVSLVD